jgi:hypothetical protein
MLTDELSLDAGNYDKATQISEKARDFNVYNNINGKSIEAITSART